MIINKTLPTGFNTLDIILGENERDLNGRLINVHRGVPIGQQGFIAAVQGAGKSTLVMQMTAEPIKLGYPCHKVIVFDTDGHVWKKNRLVKLTQLPPDEVDKYYKVYDMNTIEDIIKTIETEHKEYIEDMKANKNKMVKFFDPVRQEEVQMQPYVYLVFDTVTSINSDMYDVDGKKEITSNESSLTTFRYMANLVNTVCNFFNGNVAVIWNAHLKD